MDVSGDMEGKEISPINSKLIADDILKTSWGGDGAWERERERTGNCATLFGFSVVVACHGCKGQDMEIEHSRTYGGSVRLCCWPKLTGYPVIQATSIRFSNVCSHLDRRTGILIEMRPIQNPKERK